ncbi:hypothetical protein N2599_31315 (plasmid) [Rhizobium sullae]|uniref:Uncharacterized protein n=1 Tax=Rhizobium sullae TaxID=50338 RepID=A0ABY5XRJ8_RHISU|nr:hypothetical protein [Rhizobium sullae]UWU17255.1 hypothetical protein N2599_31315 [Rhizobium sullae]
MLAQVGLLDEATLPILRAAQSRVLSDAAEPLNTLISPSCASCGVRRAACEKKDATTGDGIATKEADERYTLISAAAPGLTIRPSINRPER